MVHRLIKEYSLEIPKEELVARPYPSLYSRISEKAFEYLNSLL